MTEEERGARARRFERVCIRNAEKNRRYQARVFDTRNFQKPRARETRDPEIGSARNTRAVARASTPLPRVTHDAVASPRGCRSSRDRVTSSFRTPAAQTRFADPRVNASVPGRQDGQGR